VVGLSAEIYQQAGITTVALSIGELVPAAQRGLIDGAQPGNPANDIKLGLADVFKTYYHPSAIAPAYALDLYVNKARWNEVSSSTRQIIETACADSAEAMVAEQERLDRDALAQMARRGVTVAPLPPAIGADLYAASEKAMAGIRASNPSFDKIMRIADPLRPKR
jgi:TRAP-type mannitol/chloroaromatic compound transport system substrate-binding protein